MVRLNGGQSHPKSGPRGPGRAHRRRELRALIFGSAMPPRESPHVAVIVFEPHTGGAGPLVAATHRLCASRP